MRLLFAAFFFLLGGHLPPLSAQTLRYTIDVEARSETDIRLGVDLEMTHSNRDTLYLIIPRQVNEVADLFKHYKNWAVTGGRIVGRDSGLITIKRTDKTAPTLKVHYDIVSPVRGDALTRSNSAAPLLQPAYLHIRGYSLFLVPAHYKTFDVEVNWRQLPKGWMLQNSFSGNVRKQHFVSLSREDWRRTNWVAGHFRQYEAKVFGKPVFFALRGNWNFDDTTLFNIIVRTVKTQRELWDDRDIDFYSVTLMPYKVPPNASDRDKKSGSLGNGLYQSFVTYADEATLLDDFIDLFNHEMMHEWIGGRIDDGKPTETVNLHWMVEGFTEYYALRNRWRAGFMTEEEFFKEINKEYFQKHYNSPYAELPNLEAAEREHDDFELERLPYRRGCIAAFYLDMAIRRRSMGQKNLFKSLNDMMEYTYGTGRTLSGSYDFFTETLAEYYGPDLEKWLEIHINQGQKVKADEFELPNYLLLNTLPDGTPQFRLNPRALAGESLFLQD